MQVAKLAEAIERFGWTVPCVVTPKGEVLGGHGRLMAAERLGIADVPCVVVDGWSEADRREYRLAENRLAEMSGWDDDLLKSELAALAEITVPLDLWDDVELDPTGGVTDEDETPEPPAEPVSKAGDVWVLGDHRLMCGDSTNAEDVARLLDGASPHLMVTDPPYGVEYDPDWRNRADRANGKPYGARAIGAVQNDDEFDWSAAWALFPGDVAYVWHAAWYASAVQASVKAAGFEVRCQIIWAKDRLIFSRGHYHWQHEPCWYAVRKGGKGHWAGDRKQTTVWEIEHRKSETGHGTQKPVECMRRPIQNNSKRGAAVYEPFSGSGTTIIAAETTGRRCYAMEISPAYVDVAVQRWEKFTGKKAERVTDG